MSLKWYISYIGDKTHRVFGRLAWWYREWKLRNCNFTWGEIRLETDAGKWVAEFLKDRVCKIRTVEDLLYVLLRELNLNFLWLSLFGEKLKDHKHRREDVAFDLSKALNRFLEVLTRRGIIKSGSAWWGTDSVMVYVKYRNWWIREIAIGIDITNEGLKPYIRYICHDIGVKYYNGVGEFC